jgi:hypothetical protein
MTRESSTEDSNFSYIHRIDVANQIVLSNIVLLSVNNTASENRLKRFVLIVRIP